MTQVDMRVVLMIAACICLVRGDVHMQPQPHEPEVIPVAEDVHGGLGDGQAPNVHCSCNCALPPPTDRQTCDSVGRMQSDMDALLTWKGTATNHLHHLKNSLQTVSKRLDNFFGMESSTGSRESSVSREAVVEDIVANVTAVLVRTMRQQMEAASERIVWELKGPYPLGVESGDIPDAQLTASSEYDSRHGPRRARLNAVADDDGIGAWCSKINNAYQWLQVDLGKLAEVWGVQTQGRFRDYNEWVQTYNLTFSGTDGANWRPYIDDKSGLQKIFRGNKDSDTPQRHLLASPVTARYVRFHPQTFHNHVCMRVEILGRFV